MSDVRTVKKVIKGIPSMDGAGVHLVRMFGNYDVKDFDPFLMMDAFDSKDPRDYVKGFPWHPHRGIETITYLISGDVEHGDSLGNQGSILDGECQWMTAGSGIIHQEMPKHCKHMLGVQLWLNLPAKYKMVAPTYHGIKASNIPIIQEGQTKIHVISGHYKDTKGAMLGEYVEAQYLDVELKAGQIWTMETPTDHTLFVYIVDGGGFFAPNSSDVYFEKNIVLFNSGSELFVQANNKEMRFLVLSAKPINEPVAWGGPIVMNTQKELQQAFSELEDGTFIKENT
ncbi:MAG: pirin family protein [Candidatus Riflemargulisbacteria bacterium]